ncbi:MAG TPA: hypothetical protein VM012_08950 [Flavitalea sp.]|nr:hypothetical protein [Flavitalea sp.]
MKTTLNKKVSYIIALFLCFFSLFSYSQKIAYSDPERDDNRRTNFEIIGKVGGNILIFKNNRSDNDISVYTQDMKLIERVNLDYMDDRWINVDFVPYSDYCWMIYQYQRRNVVYCMGVKIDGTGKPVSEPIELDTSRIGWAANNKIYSTIFSDDKQQIMVFKINSKNPKNFVFTTLLLDTDLRQKAKHVMHMPMEERNDYFTDFLLDNEGDLVFGKFIRKSGSDYVTDLRLVRKPAQQENFDIHDFRTGDKVLDEIKVKIDNTNKRYLFTSLFYKQKRGNVEGIYTVIWDKSSSGVLKETILPFNDELRRLAKGPDANLRLAFNDYFIKNIVTKKDGGFILIGESMYTTARGSSFNRWNYFNYNNPWSSPLDYYYYSPYYSPWNSPWNRWGQNQATRFHSENVMILSFNKDNELEWTNVIPKSQFDDESDVLISHQIMNTGGELHFLFNLYERRTLLLNDHSVGPDGKMSRHPTLKNLDRGFEFMPRFGKQVSARSIVMPCQYRNYLTFAKIDF